MYTYNYSEKYKLSNIVKIYAWINITILSNNTKTKIPEQKIGVTNKIQSAAKLLIIAINKCPEIILALIRIAKVKGRINLLKVSIKTIKGINI